MASPSPTVPPVARRELCSSKPRRRARGPPGRSGRNVSGQGEAEKPGPLQDLPVRSREYYGIFGPEPREDTAIDPG